MSVFGNQQQIFLRLLSSLQPHWHRDPGLPPRIQAEFARHREFGSRDRRLYRELIFTTLRFLPWVEPLLATDPDRAARIVAWLATETRDTRNYRHALCGDWPTPPTLAERAAFLQRAVTDLLPAWFRAECPAAFASPEIDTLLARAPLWLRLQTDDPADVAAEFSSRGWTWRESPALPGAWQLLGEADVTKTDAFARGHIEVQDLGSQFVLASIGVEPGTRWLDACAGAGGKTLQLARLLESTGSIDAFDVRPAALAELRQRAARAGLKRVRTVTTPDTVGYDGVLVDAPCSGSGTWRRAPHLKWTTSAAQIEDRSAQQQELLARYATFVRPGGRLVYATCSLARRENEHVIEAFLTAHPQFQPVPFAHTFGFTPSAIGLTILPSRHDTDGFFVCSLGRDRS